MTSFAPTRPELVVLVDPAGARHGEAVSAIDDAMSAVTAWCDQVRQDAEQRMGVPAGAASVIRDPRYLQALKIYADLTALRSRLTDPRNDFRE